ncbi:hypothetical protein [Bremerella sp.]|uniref:hypothetical protein n=1 Tax=Bremerella sp. TaxID=2795602 RepID=UPI00391A6E8E
MPQRWVFLSAGPEGAPLELDGIRIWQHQWQRVAEHHVEVIDPQYGQTHKFDIYEIHCDGKTIRFAAGEFSASVWGFYIAQHEVNS